MYSPFRMMQNMMDDMQAQMVSDWADPFFGTTPLGISPWGGAPALGWQQPVPSLRDVAAPRAGRRGTSTALATRPGAGRGLLTGAAIVPVRLDIIEQPESYRICADLPGLAKDDINVSVQEGVLTVSGDKEEEKTEEGETYYRRERRYGSFSRSVRLPSDADSDHVTARFVNGVLELTLPKVEEEEAGGRRTITIQ